MATAAQLAANQQFLRYKVARVNTCIAGQIPMSDFVSGEVNDTLSEPAYKISKRYPSPGDARSFIHPHTATPLASHWSREIYFRKKP